MDAKHIFKALAAGNVEDAVEALVQSEEGRELLDVVDVQLKKFAGVVKDAIVSGVNKRVEQPPPAQPKRKAGMTSAEARALLHFGPKDPLTEAVIRKRKQGLARLVHPDVGGSTEAAARINAAADVLLKQVKGKAA